MRYANIDIPDLPVAAFLKDARGQIRPQGGKGGSKPDVPDYTALAQQQTQSNLDLAKYATQANRVNQFTPYGSITWSNDRTFDQAGYDAALKAYSSSQSQPGGYWKRVPSAGNMWSDDQTYNNVWVPTSSGSSGGSAPNKADFYSGGDQWTQNMQFSPEIQALYANALRSAGSTLDMSALPDAGTVYDPNLATNNATELLLSRINPDLDRQDDQLRTRLANQGITQGSQAWNQALSNFGQTRNDAVNQAALTGIGLGIQQQGLTFDQSNALRSQALQEQSYLHSLPISDFAAILGSGQSLQFPGYAQQATTGGVDLLGAADSQYQADLGAYNAQQAQNQGLMSGLGSLAGAGVGFFGGGGLQGAALGSQIGGAAGGLFSDRRLKTDIRRIGQADDGLPIYAYRYVWGGPTQIGHMADEVERMYPDAVSTVNGYKTVDYSKVH